MSQATIYVGNLSFKSSEEEIRDFFGQYGEIADFRLIKDDLGRSKGFGFLTYSTDSNCEAALEANGKELGGRTLTVNPARERDTTTRR